MNRDTREPTPDPRLALPEGTLCDPDGHPFAVPPEGVPGLLVLGRVSGFFTGFGLWNER